MVLPAPAVADTNWLEPDALYLATGDDCEIDRPLYQGDVVENVVLPQLPSKPPATDNAPTAYAPSIAMVLPHPCQCYHGDNLRNYITIAPVREVLNFSNFGEDYSGNKDKFALPDLEIRDGKTWTRKSHVAEFGRLISVHRNYLSTGNRIACLSHQGLGLLAKRLLQFQLRHPSTLANVMTLVADQWNESFLMQAWIRRHGSLKGYTKWLRSPQEIPELDSSGLVLPYNYLTGALDVLMASVSGECQTDY